MKYNQTLMHTQQQQCFSTLNYCLEQSFCYQTL
jgi:hypothetical protein